MDRELAHQLMDIGTKESFFPFIAIKNLFTLQEPLLAYILHEALSTYLCGLKDIKYPYEDHKIICPYQEGSTYSEWSHGMGHISPHSDDLYEEIECDLLSLTLCRDIFHCPTKLYTYEDLFLTFSAHDKRALHGSEATFISGKNVKGARKKRTRKLASQSHQLIKYRLDFRIDKDTGYRMIPLDRQARKILEHLRESISEARFSTVGCNTGTFILMDNSRVMHARDSLQAIKGKCASRDRLLFRSKGQKCTLNRHVRSL